MNFDQNVPWDINGNGKGKENFFSKAVHEIFEGKHNEHE